jgi:hypothetical protein
MNLKREGYILTVTADINEKFIISWGNPTEDQTFRFGYVQHRLKDGWVDAPYETTAHAGSLDHLSHLDGVIHTGHDDLRGVIIEEAIDAHVSKDRKTLVITYEGKNQTYIVMHSSLIPILKKFDVIGILRPQNFHQSRTGGRICHAADGMEFSILTMIGWHLGIENPTWSTRNCWNEDPTKVIDRSAKPIGGSKEYMKAYYQRTTEVRRAAKAEMKKAKALATIEQKTRTDTIDDIIASLKGNGGGGPRQSDAKSPIGRTILGRDIPRGDSEE